MENPLVGRNITMINTDTNVAGTSVLDTPLVMLGENDPWTIRDSFEGVQVFGGTGSGKTSSAKTFASSFLEAGYGGLVLTVKPEETQQWQEWVKEAGRGDQLITIHPSNPYFFDFLEYEAQRSDGSDTQTMVSLFMLIIEIANGGSIKGREPYFELALRQMQTNAIDLLKCAAEPITVENIYRLIVTAPTSISRLGASDWREKSYCFKCLNQASDNYDKSVGAGITELHFEDFDIAFLYWTNEFPNLSEKTRSIIVSMFTTTADAFIRGNLKKLFITDKGKHPAPPDLARQGAIIILDLPIKLRDNVGKIGQGVYKLMFQKAMERNVYSESSRPVFIWSDENQFFINSYDLEFQQTARSSGVATFYLTQNIPNYYVNLGDDGLNKANSLLGNLSTKIFLAQPDSATNEWAAKIFGEAWAMQSSSSSSFDPDNETRMSASISEHKRHIIEPIEFTQLLRGGPKNDYIVSAIIHQIGRTWSNGENFIETFFKQSTSG